MQRKTLFAVSAAVIVAAAAMGPLLWSSSASNGAGIARAATEAASPAATAPQSQAGLAPLSQADLIKRGEYLAHAGDCIACHMVRGGKPYAGGYALPTPFGTLYSPNLTPDKETGIGSWTSDDFYRAMHTGHAKDGSFLYPAFPYTSYTKVTRSDTDAIYAYLQSIPPVHQENTANAMPFPFNIRMSLMGWQIMFFSKGEYEPDHSKSVEWNRGAYLVEGLGHCGMCHTSINPLGGPIKSAAYAGGLIPLQNWYAPSLTSDKEEGVGGWSVDELSDFLKKGVSAKGAVYGPMSSVVHESLQYLSDDDIRAMSVYLKSLPQKDHAPEHLQLEVSDDFGKQLLKEGEHIYVAQCATCHQANGKGAPPGYPPLAHNQSITMDSAVNPIRIVLNGGYPPSTQGNPHPVGMPPFAQALSDREVAAVVTYVRHSWDNNAKPVSPQQVSELRSTPMD
jgi:mono/diheme cytochrome c family protein